jgi:16S rRNA (uracil1498-N3)-methyltransferase
VIAVLVEPGTLAAGESLTLAEEEAHHLRVRRAADGESLRLLDGAGTVATGELQWSGKKATVEVGVLTTIDPFPPLVLAVGAGDRERFGWLAEKAAELAVTDLIPLATSHAHAVGSRIRQEQLGRIQARAREALKQSGAAWAPRIHSPLSVEQFCDRPADGLRWLAQSGAAAPAAVLAGEPVTVAIGPEGGWTGDEADRLLAAGYQPVALAAHILRFETAAVAAATLIGVARLRGARD